MIVVFGSINLDLVARVAELPEPGQTVLSPDYAALPGGKGANQALAAARAGAGVELVGRVGSDPFGDLALTGLVAAGVGLTRVARSARSTGVALIGVDAHGENQIIVAAGANRDVGQAQVEDDLLTSGTTVVAQMEIEPKENWRLFERAEAAAARVILNVAPAAPTPLAALRRVDVLVANAGEAAALAEEHGVDRGGEPVDLARRIGRLSAGALPIDPVDTTGAGDAFVGALAAALDGGRTLADSLARASAAGGLACLCAGAQSPPTAREIAEATRTITRS